MCRFLSCLVLLTCVAFCEPAWACSCLEPQSPSQAYESAVAIFRGTPVSVAPLGGFEIVFEFEVEEVWKGDLGPVQRVATEGDGAACGYPFEVGQEYLVYSFHVEDGLVYTGLCTRNAPIEEAIEDLLFLGDGQPTSSEVEPEAVALSLATPFPNPCRRQTTLTITNNAPGCANLRILDALGQVRHATSGVACSRGSHAVSVALDDIPAGLYFVEVSTDEGVARTSLTVVP